MAGEVLKAMAAIRRAMMAPPPDEPIFLVIPSVVFDRGEEWCRRAYGVGRDVEIIEAVALTHRGGPVREPRRYVSASSKRKPRA